VIKGDTASDQPTSSLRLLEEKDRNCQNWISQYYKKLAIGTSTQLKYETTGRMHVECYVCTYYL